MERNPTNFQALSTYLKFLMQGLLTVTALFGRAIKPNPAEPVE